MASCYRQRREGRRAGACAVHVRQERQENRLFLSPILWYIFAVAKAFTERKDLLGTPLFFLLLFVVFSQVIPPRYQGTKGRQAGRHNARASLEMPFHVGKIFAQ
jgi:hypothetical protein